MSGRACGRPEADGGGEMSMWPEVTDGVGLLAVIIDGYGKDGGRAAVLGARLATGTWPHWTPCCSPVSLFLFFSSFLLDCLLACFLAGFLVFLPKSNQNS